eukprot:jgi/Mesvir1/25517/Mv01767-RA.1
MGPCCLPQRAPSLYRSMPFLFAASIHYHQSFFPPQFTLPLWGTRLTGSGSTSSWGESTRRCSPILGEVVCWTYLSFPVPVGNVLVCWASLCGARFLKRAAAHLRMHAPAHVLITTRCLCPCAQAGAGSTSAEPQVPLAGVATAMPRPRTVRRALRSCHQDPVGGSASIHPGFSESNMREHGARTADHGMMPPGTWAKPSMTRSALGGAAMTADLPRGAAGRQPAGTHKRQGNMADITNSASAYTEGSPCKKLRTVHEAEAFPAGTEACGGVDVGDDGRRRKSCHSRLSSLPEDFAPMVISSPPAVVAPRRQSLSHLTARPAERAGVPGQATGGLQPRAAPFAMDHFGVGPGGLGCIGSQGTDNLMPTFFSPGKNHPREPASKRDASSGHLHRRTRQQGHAMAAGGASLGGVGATRRASMGSGRPSLSGSLPRSSQGGSKRRMEHWDAGELCSWVDALDMGIDSHRLVQRGVTGRALKNASAAELAFILGINMHQALRVAHEVAACRVSGGQAVAWR